MVAQMVEPEHIVKMLDLTLVRGRFPDRDHVMIMLSFYGGLRAAEVAGLRFEDVVNVEGQVGTRLSVRKGAKFGKPRDFALPARVGRTLSEYIARYQITEGPLFLNQFGEPQSSNAYQQQFARIARECGFHGVTSHSGRRTLITKLARGAGRGEYSLRDVQHLAGHASLTSTQAYIDRCEITGTMIELAVEAEKTAPMLESGKTRNRDEIPDESLYARMIRLRRMRKTRG